VDKIINAPSGDLKLTGSGDVYTDKNFGVGAVPQRALDINKPFSNAFIRITRNDNAAAYGALEFAGSDNVVDWSIGTNLATLGEFQIRQGSQSRFYINSTGNTSIISDAGTYPALEVRHSLSEVEGEVLRFTRTDSPSIRYHSIKAYHSGTANSNRLSFFIHDAGTTTHQDEVLRLGISSASDPAAELSVRTDGNAGIGNVVSGVYSPSASSDTCATSNIDANTPFSLVVIQ